MAGRLTAKARGPLALYLAVGAGYAVCSQLAFTWFNADGASASFFPAAGVTLAALVLVRRILWPVVLAAAATAELVLDLSHGIDLAPTLGYIAANVSEPLVGAVLLTSIVRTVDLSRTRDLVVFAGAAVIAGPAVGGALGASTNVFLAEGENWGRFMAEWWVGDGLGVLVLGGAILAFRSQGLHPHARLRVLEATVLPTVVLLGTVVVFWLEWLPLVYLPIAVLFAMAFRVGTKGVALTGSGAAFIAAQATAEGHVFWDAIDVSPETGLLYLQLALAVVIASALALAAEIAQRERAAVAWATAETARREADLAADREERLRRLAEELARASSISEVSSTIAAHGLDLGARAGEREAARDELYEEAAARLAHDALKRAELFEAEREARRRAELLERNAAHLAAATTVHEVASSTVADLADAGVAVAALDLVRGDTVEILAAIGLSQELVDAHRTYPLASSRPGADAIRTGMTIEISTGEEFDARYPEAAVVRKQSGVESVLAVPLRAGDGRIIGALLATSPTPHWIDQGTRQLLVGVAEQCGLALERALLHADAAASAADSAFLALLADTLDNATGVAERAARLVEALTSEQAPFAAVHLLDDEGQPRLVSSSGRSADALEGQVAALVQEALARGEAVEPGQALVALALRARGRTLGSLTVATAPPDEAPSPTLLREVASRAAVALDNAMLYERERDVSHSLQIGLLGGALTRADGVEIGAVYMPGTATLEVGGDWYDAFQLANGSLALVVGDVVGHGLEAAVAMGQLRGAVRALASGATPARLLEGLDAFVATVPEAGMATFAYVELEPSGGAIRYACAGHPPPLVVSPDGTTRYLWEGRSVALGSSLPAERRDATDRLEEGETLVLFTDGLVERRAESLDVGLERLAATAAERRRTPSLLARELCDAILDRETQDDDVCVLTVHRVAAPAFAHSFPAHPSELAALRRRLAAWLAELGADDEVRQGAVLAVCEAATNALEHAYGCDSTGVVAVLGRLDDGSVELTVRDNGAWQEPRGSDERGRGIPIMEAVMDEVRIERSADGTAVQMRCQLRALAPA